jgi:hypothetical protein
MAEFSGSLAVGGLDTIDDDDDDLESFMTGLSMSRTALRRNRGGCVWWNHYGRAGGRYYSTHSGNVVCTQSRYVQCGVRLCVWPGRNGVLP